MIIELTNELLRSLTNSEKSVVDYINTNEDRIPELSIHDLAEASYTSIATVSRAIRKCGINGISELRYKISSKKSYNPNTRLLNEILQKSIIESTRTIENIRVDTIFEIIKNIKKAKRIYILARGTTGSSITDFELQLQLLGYNAFLLTDSEVMKKADKLFQETDLIIIFSVKNSTPELAIAASLAKKVGSKVVLCCCKPRTELNDYADLVVVGHIQEDYADSIENFGASSKLSLQVIARIIIDYLTL